MIILLAKTLTTNQIDLELHANVRVIICKQQHLISVAKKAGNKNSPNQF